MTAHALAMTMIQDILGTTGITATAGIGTNMYLCKIAMDIVAKHIEPDKTVYELPNLTKCHTEDCYGITDPLQIFGESVVVIQRN